MATKPIAPEILLPVCTASFPNLFKPKLAPGSTKPKFSIACIWSPENVPLLKAAKEECGKLLLAVYGEKWIEMVKAGQLFWPFKPIVGILVKPGYPEGGVMANINANEDSPPYVFSRYRDPATGKARVITDPKEVYAGAQVIVLAKPYLFDVTAKKGVTMGLQAVQKWDDGPRLDGRSDPTDKFAAEEEPAATMPTAQSGSATASLDEMLTGNGAASL